MRSEHENARTVNRRAEAGLARHAKRAGKQRRSRAGGEANGEDVRRREQHVAVGAVQIGHLCVPHETHDGQGVRCSRQASALRKRATGEALRIHVPLDISHLQRLCDALGK